MIKINLVTRISKKAEGFKRLLTVLSIIPILLIVGVFYVSADIDAEFLDLGKKVEIANAEYKKVEGKIKELENFKALKTDFASKLKIIKSLKEKQTGPVKMLDLLSSSVPQEIWITSIRNFGNLTVKGISFSNPAIADFMEKLSEANGFKGVKLLQSMQRTVAERKVKEFQIVSDIDYQYLKDYTNIDSSKILHVPMEMLRKNKMKFPLPYKLGLVAIAEQVER